MRAYQTSRTRIAANSCRRDAIGAGQDAHYRLTTALRACRSSRPATTKLAANRLMSHSQGAGKVSSKSFRSKTRLRSGVANRPKLDRWQSPHACTRMPLVGVVARSSGHHRRRAAQECKGARQHPAIADGDQLGHAALVRLFQDGDRVAAFGRRLPRTVRCARRLRSQCPAHLAARRQSQAH